MSFFNRPQEESNADIAQDSGANNQMMQQALTMMGEAFQMIKETQAQMAQMAQENTQFQQQIMQNGMQGQAQAAKQENVRSLSSYTDDELEEMSPRQRAAISEENTKHMMKKILSDSIAPLKNEFETTSRETRLDKARNEISTFSGQVDDFNTWLPEMQKLGGKVQGLSVEDLYHFTKMKNPNKVAQLEQIKKAKEDANKPQSYGGLFPNLRGGKSDGKVISLEDAATQGFQEILAEPGALESLETA